MDKICTVPLSIRLSCSCQIMKNRIVSTTYHRNIHKINKQINNVMKMSVKLKTYLW